MAIVTEKLDTATKLKHAQDIILSQWHEFLEEAKKKSTEDLGEDGFGQEIDAAEPKDIAATFFEWMEDYPMRERE